MNEKKTGRRTAKEAIETKKHILHVATNLFCEKGYERVSLRHISELAGVSHSLIRYHFGSKEQIWYAINDSIHEKISAYVIALIADIDKKSPPNLRLYLFSVRLLAYLLWDSKPMKFAADMVRQEDKFLNYFADSYDEFDEIIGNMVSDFNKQYPEYRINIREHQWALLTSAHAAHSLGPLMKEIWEDQATNPAQLMFNHWQLFNTQTALQLKVDHADMLSPTQLESLILPSNEN